MNIVSWNVNSIRRRTHKERNTLAALLHKAKPDVVCLQELQCTAEQVPYLRLKEAGYQALISAQKGKNGVAILVSSHASPLTTYTKVPWPPPGHSHRSLNEARLCAAEFRGVVIASVYAPYGQTPASLAWQEKQVFFEALATWSRQVIGLGQPLLLAGDFNVAPSDADWSCEPNDLAQLEQSRASWPSLWQAWCHPEMRQALQQVLDVGLFDLMSSMPGRQALTLFDERNLGPATTSGLRIDLLLGTRDIQDRLVDIAVLSEVRRWKNPSDHLPVVAKFLSNL